MAKSPAEIASFIQTNTEEYWSNSPLVKSKTADEWFFKATQWTNFRDDLKKDAEKDSIEQFIQDLATSNLDTALNDSFTGAIANSYRWAANPTEGTSEYEALESARQTFRNTYNATGDFQAAMAAAQGNAKFQSEAEWQNDKVKYENAYGKSWDNLTDEQLFNLRSAYDIEKEDDRDRAIQGILQSYSLFSESAEKKKQFAAVNENGTWVVKQVDPKKNKNAVKYDDAYKQALFNIERDKAWAEYISQKQQEFGESWENLSDDALTAIHKKFNTSYNKVKDLAQIKDDVVLKGYTNRLGDENLLGEDKWSIFWDATHKLWYVRQALLQKTKKKAATKNPTTYENAQAAADKNNQLYQEYQAALAEYKKNPKSKKNPNGLTKPTAPSYDTKYQYDIGGMVKDTGMAFLHADESVLTSQQTDILRNEILGKQNNSLLNLLLDFRRAYNNFGDTGIQATPSIIIENASVNMHVDQIANDYDARRAGEQALAEMLKIARKNGATSVLRR